MLETYDGHSLHYDGTLVDCLFLHLNVFFPQSILSSNRHLMSVVGKEMNRLAKLVYLVEMFLILRENVSTTEVPYVFQMVPRSNCG